MIGKAIYLFISFLSLSLLYAAPQEVLVVGTNAEFPPFCYIENKTVVGFDIDVAQEVGKRLGKTVEFKDMPFDALIPALVLGHIDFVAAGMSYTEERAKRVLFTKSYLSEDPLVIFSASPQNTSLESLKGKSVIVIEGFTADLFMSDQGDIDLIRLNTQADGFMAIKSGRADALVTAKSTVDAFSSVQDTSSFFISPLEGTGETCALVIPKNQPDRRIRIQQALDDMERDGTMAQLKAKWKLQ